MFGFLDMMGTYESRKVDNYESENGVFVIDTAMVTDGDYDYETAVTYEGFNEGKWMIVEQYDTKEEAQEGHNRWIEKLNNEEPIEFKDIDVCFGGVTTRTRIN